MTTGNAILHARSALAFFGLISLCGCASIVDGNPRPKISIDSTPPGALVTIYDKGNSRVDSETTPFVTRLRRSSGYFSGANYRLVFELPGYQKAQSVIYTSINGWYFGNLLIGGLVGMVFVDPATGAMWTLHPKTVNEILEPLPTPVAPSGNAAPAAPQQGAPPMEQAPAPPAPSQPPETQPTPQQ